MQRLTRPGGLTVVEFYARSYRVFRYYTGRRRGRKSARFMEHYPSAGEVRDIIGEPFEPIPLRVGASRLVHRYFGEAVLRGAIAAARHARFLLDEYLVAQRKEAPEEPQERQTGRAQITKADLRGPSDAS